MNGEIQLISDGDGLTVLSRRMPDHCFDCSRRGRGVYPGGLSHQG